ncbi:metalloregulator ArsR/SmtB family transcription factor [Pyramidobacter sp.]|uniref:ArsR/SmtB family transcription factor n=1 Tax=Pyramidobacter sp. TaxID=1943581 RepID=UPI0033173C3B
MAFDDDERMTAGPSAVRERAVEAVRRALPDEEKLRKLAEFFKIFGDPTRMRILCALKASELCVYDLTRLMGVSQPAVSHQLGLLRAAHAVRARREGKTVYYSLDDEHVSALLRVGLEHIGHRFSGGR